MFEVRVHGRGGQGVVTAAELLSVAAFLEGRHAQAFPSFGSERTGAPVVAFCRIDDHTIRSREPVVRPDAVIIQDVTLLHQVQVFDGLRPDGYLLVNSARGFDELGYSITKLAERPDQIYTGWVRRALLTVVPLAFIVSVPARVFFEGLTLETLASAVAIVLAGFALVVWFWSRALAVYSSASS